LNATYDPVKLFYIKFILMYFAILLDVYINSIPLSLQIKLFYVTIRFRSRCQVDFVLIRIIQNSHFLLLECRTKFHFAKSILFVKYIVRIFSSLKGFVISIVIKKIFMNNIGSSVLRL